MIGEESDWEGAKSIGRWLQGHKSTEPMPKDQLALCSPGSGCLGGGEKATGRSLQ